MAEDDKKETVDMATAAADEQRIAVLSRRLRHVGYTLFGGLALAICLFLSYCLITAIEHREVLDPVTGAPVTRY